MQTNEMRNNNKLNLKRINFSLMRINIIRNTNK